MNVILKKTILSGEIDVVASKSLSHRYLIASALCFNQVTTLKNLLTSDDLEATKLALLNLGVKINNTTITSPKSFNILAPTINCRESGSTLRFMIPIYGLLNHSITFNGNGLLPTRPLNIYEKIFKDQCLLYKQTTSLQLPLEIKGPLNGSTFHIPGNISSQFISGLFFALPLCTNDSIINITTLLESKDYCLMTIDVLKKFNIIIEKIHENQFYIKGNQTYKSHSTNIEADFSHASFWIVAAVFGANLSIKNLNFNSLQGDAKILNIIKQFGATYTITNNILIVNSTKTKGCNIDLAQIPDLGPILFVLASLSSGTTVFTNTHRLRLKESNRVDCMVNELRKLGALITIIDENTVHINGIASFKGNVILNSHNDHRIAMALSIASLKADGAITINNASCINKSYPTFYDELERLGAQLSFDKIDL